MMAVLSVLGWVLMFGGAFGLGVWFVRVHDDIANKTVVTSLATRFEDDLQKKTEQQLEELWLFKFDPAISLERNLYRFHDLLGLYERQCRRWEEHHNGICCVVERVRDKYLWPKIQQFAADAKAFCQDSAK